MANGRGAAAERHRAETTRLRAEVEGLVRQAHLLLHGELNVQQAPKPAHPKRTEREKELEAALEKADWYRREIKRLKQELESRDHRVGGPSNPRDRDPMEVQNLLAEKRKELQRIHRAGEGLLRVAELQRQAERAQNAMSPEIEELLKASKRKVEEEKLLNVKLQGERLKLSRARKEVEDEVRAAGKNLRSQAAQLQKPTPAPAAAGVTEESKLLRHLQRDLDIVRDAMQKDERRFQAEQREDAQEVDFTVERVASLQEALGGREADVSRLKAELAREPQHRPSPRRRPSELLSPGFRRVEGEDGAQGSAPGSLRSQPPDPSDGSAAAGGGAATNATPVQA